MKLHQPLVEQYVLNCIMQKPEIVEEVRPYFLSNIGKTLFSTFESLYKRKAVFDNSNIILECARNGVNLDDVKIDALRDINADLGSLQSYQEQLKKYYLRNDLKANQIKNLVIEVEKEDADFNHIGEILDSCKSTLSQLHKKESNFYTLGESLESHKDVIRGRGKGLNSYPTGVGLIDRYNILGYTPQYMTTVFGSSGTGKTTVACNLVNSCINLQYPCVYDTLELSKEFFIDKLVSLRTGIPFSTFLNATEDGEDFSEPLVEIIEKERQKVKAHNRFVILEEVSQSISDLDYEIPHIKKFMGVDHLVLHIDLATMLKDFSKNGDTTASVYEKSVNTLHELCRRHNIHIVNYVQALRDQNNVHIKNIEDVEKFAPSLASIKNSSAFEERSRLVLGLFRPYYYAERYLKHDPRFELMNNIIEMRFLKQTAGNLPTLEFLFKGDTGRIFPLREQREESPVTNY